MGREKIFRFKQFCVLNDKTAMKVGTDGVLLGAWCEIEGARNILDVGTGCGLIALMLAQRNKNANICSIDIDGDAIEEAICNFKLSPWADRLVAKEADFNVFDFDERFDVIVSNPPFFTNGILPPCERRSHARHSMTLTYQGLISRSRDLLMPEGTLAIITPADVSAEIRRCVAQSRMSVKRQTSVVPVVGNAPKRVLWELVPYEANTTIGSIAIETVAGCYSKEYVELTKDFYIKF